MTEQPDPAAILGAAMSLYEEGHKQAAETNANLSEEYNGIDEFMRCCMIAAEKFERWACRCVDFNEISDPWPYLLSDRFGVATYDLFGLTGLKLILSDESCRRLAQRMKIPLKP